MKEIELNVEGMHCSGCENRVKNTVSGIKGVSEVTANHETGKVVVKLKKENDAIKEEIVNAIERTGDFQVK